MMVLKGITQQRIDGFLQDFGRECFSRWLTFGADWSKVKVKKPMVQKKQTHIISLRYVRRDNLNYWSEKLFSLYDEWQ